jgi:hypothetical protein
VIGFLDMGSSIAFFTKLRIKREYGREKIIIDLKKAGQVI